MRIRDDKNIIHPGGGPRKLSGKKISSTSSDILFKDVKAAAKNKSVTINDLITACMASGVKQYFELKGDQNKTINIAIPANIRFEHYGTWERVKFENKFAAIPLLIPLNKDINQSLTEVAKVTSQLRH